MTQTVARILSEAEHLSVAEREELADRLVESLVRDVPPGVQDAHIAEVRWRIAEVESGKVSLVPWSGGLGAGPSAGQLNSCGTLMPIYGFHPEAGHGRS